MESRSPLSGFASSQESRSNSATSLRPEETLHWIQDSPRHQYVTPLSSSSSLSFTGVSEDTSNHISTASSSHYHAKPHPSSSKSIASYSSLTSYGYYTLSTSPTQQHPQAQARSPRGQFATPPPFPTISDGLFTPPTTAAGAPIPLDSLFTPPPSPPRSAAKQQPRKKKVSRISHVLIPPPPLYVQQSKRHTEAATAGPSQPKGKPAKPPPLEIDVWNQGWADNHDNPYPDVHQLGLRRKKKKPGHLKQAVTRLDGPDFEDNLDDGDLEDVLAVEGEDWNMGRLKRKGEAMSTSKRKRKRSPTYSYSQDAGPSHLSHRVSSQQALDVVTSRNSTPASRPTSVPPTVIHASVHRSSSVNAITRPSSSRLSPSVACTSRQVTPCPSLHNTPRIPESGSYYMEDEEVHFILPPVWPPPGSVDHSYLATVVNTRFARAPLPSGSLSNPIVIGEEPEGKTRTPREKSDHRHPMAVCPVLALGSDSATDDNGDEFDFVTHVLRFPPSPPRNPFVDPTNLQGSVPISSSTLQGKPPRKKNKKTASVDDRRRVSSKLRPASPSLTGDDYAFTSGDGTSSLSLKIRIPARPLSEKSRGKQKAIASPVATQTSGPVDPDSFSWTDDHATHSLSYPLPESGAFDRPPPAVVTHPSHALTASPDQAPFLSLQPPSPITFPSDSAFDPVRDYLGLDDDSQDFVTDPDDPIFGPIDVSFGPNDAENDSATIDPSIFRPELLRSKSPDLFGSSLDEETWTPSLSPSLSPPPPSPVLRTLYDGAKLPPRSVSRVVSLKTRACPTSSPRPPPPPRRSEPPKSALALLQDYDSDDSDEETGAQDTATNGSSSEKIFAPNLGSPLSSGQVHDADESSAPYWGEDSDETSSTSSEDDDANQPEAEVSRNKSPGSSTQPTERGPYAHFYNLLPTKDDVTSIPRKKIQWPTVETQRFCHQCRAKSNRMFLACEAGGCNKSYCMRCIVTRYEEDSFAYLKTVTIFECPSCSGWCTCDVCTTRRGEVYVPLRKPGPASKIAREEPLIRATDTADKSLDYWGPIYDATGETQIAKGYFSNGDVDDVVVAQLLSTSRARRKVKRRIKFVGATQPGWKRSSKVADRSGLDKELEGKGRYVGRRPPPPSALYDSELDGFDSPLTDWTMRKASRRL
ncbi:hypothetical protein PM082_008594 [Marasmius tenuissimus]|nr:hypothetical protein PM082_008594 [Marasmius tenuissimus]